MYHLMNTNESHGSDLSIDMHTTTLQRRTTLNRSHTLSKKRTNVFGHPAKVNKMKSNWSTIKLDFAPWFWTIAHFTLTMATFIWSYQKYNGFTISNSSVISNPTAMQERIQQLGLRPTVGIAKASAAVINLQLGLILIPVSRSLISAFRASFMNNVMPFDSAVTAHKGIGIYFVVFSVLHVIGHMFNYYLMEVKAAALPMVQQMLTNMPASMDASAYLWLTTTPGWTGLICELFAFLAFTGSMLKVRRQNFEIFYYSHHLFIIVFIFLVPHGESCFVPQVASIPCGTGGDFKKSVFVGVIFYIMERIVMRHFVRNPAYSKIVKVVRHPGNVMELNIQPPEKIGGSLIVNKSVPGSIIMINCPSVSKHEYHPFTLTSCPSMGVWSVHIRCTGDWTKQFAAKCGISFSHNDKEKHIDEMPNVKIDGPFITECIDAIKSSVSVFIGAGIGVTPFAALLRDTLTRIVSGNTDIIIKKVYFFWICKDTYSFEWFIELMTEFEGYYHLIEPYIYITRVEDPLTIMLETTNDDADLVTGLPFQSFFGRPNWTSLFKEMNQSHIDDDIGIFVCGPKALSTAVKNASEPYENMAFNEAHFE